MSRSVVTRRLRPPRPDRLAKIDLVADAELALREHEEAVQVVADEGLRAQPDCEPCDAGGREQREEVDPELREDEENRDRPDQGDHEAARDAPLGVVARIPKSAGAAPAESSRRPSRPPSSRPRG